jgi:DMSO/TMAO reductase YedYZ molybdopterin-dependent catalytic subunit
MTSRREIRWPPAPPGPFRPAFWRSPLRGPWLTSVLGLAVLAGTLVVAATGFLSHAAYDPDLGRNAIVDRGHDLQPLVFDWPTSPTWLYAVSQGLHVTVGLATVPFLLAKLWSVIPRFFAWPPVRSPAMALERLSLLALVGGAAFQFATGILNIQLFYPWHFNFVVAHYYGAWVFTTALLVHVGVKLPVLARAFRDRGVVRPLRHGLAQTTPEPVDPDGVAPVSPAAPTLSRRGFLAVVTGASAVLAATVAGQSIGGPVRRLALLAPRGRVWGSAPNDFPVNKTAAIARVGLELTGPTWRLQLAGPSPSRLSRDELLAMPLHTEELPIACVEGWSTTQRWTGVRLRDLAARAGFRGPVQCHVESLQPQGAFRQTTLSAGQVGDSRSLLALRVNGADLSPDHGYPARIIVPALPGVHCTKWVAALTFRET